MEDLQRVDKGGSIGVVRSPATSEASDVQTAEGA